MSTLDSKVLSRIEARVGTTVRGKYHLDELLGIGGAGAVFAATHRNGTRVALKVLHRELAKRADMRARFLREGYVANKIQHPGVVRVLDDDDDESDQTVFLVMDLLAGESLERRWSRLGPSMTLPEPLLHADRILDVLAAAHAAGVVHRDIKPDNVFLTTKGDLKVLDFGIARLLDGSGATKSGEVFGTPAFMPPEQASGRVRQIDGRSDVWSVGAVVFTLLTGVHVHDTPYMAQQMILAATTVPRSIASVLATIPSDVAAIIDRALAFEPSARWPTAREMQLALRATRLYEPPPAPVLATTTIPPAETIAEPGETRAFGSSTTTLLQGSGSGGAQSQPEEDAFPLRRKD
jgi:serine/threonine protein kinase